MPDPMYVHIILSAHYHDNADHYQQFISPIPLSDGDDGDIPRLITPFPC